MLTFKIILIDCLFFFKFFYLGRKKSDVANGRYQKVNWMKFHEVSILLWYPWIEFPKMPSVDR